MHAVKVALAALAATAVHASAIDGDEVFAVLLKRQEPGTPAYNCHDNCGQAIIQARSDPDICDDDGFLSNYANCLQCAGPDNVGIWQYYGNSLAKAGESCGLDTEPAEGKQPDVGEAVPADDGGSSSPSESTSASLPPSETTSVSPPTSESEASTTESEVQAEPSDTGSDDATPTESGAEVEPTASDDDAEASPTDDEEATSTEDTDAQESDDANASGAPSATSPPEVDAAGSLTIGFAGLGAAAVGFAVLLV